MPLLCFFFCVRCCPCLCSLLFCFSCFSFLSVDSIGPYTVYSQGRKFKTDVTCAPLGQHYFLTAPSSRGRGSVDPGGLSNCSVVVWWWCCGCVCVVLVVVVCVVVCGVFVCVCVVGVFGWLCVGWWVWLYRIMLHDQFKGLN